MKTQQKFFAQNDLAYPKPDDIAENDAGLPAPILTERAKMVESWCKQGTWAMCEECGSMIPRRMEPSTMLKGSFEEMEEDQTLTIKGIQFKSCCLALSVA